MINKSISKLSGALRAAQVVDDADPLFRVLVACGTRRYTEELYDSAWFAVPPAAGVGQTPKLGVLHPILVRKAAAAWKAVATG